MDLPRLELLETPECKRVKTKTVKVENMESQHGILKRAEFRDISPGCDIRYRETLDQLFLHNS